MEHTASLIWYFRTLRRFLTRCKATMSNFLAEHIVGRTTLVVINERVSTIYLMGDENIHRQQRMAML